MNERRKDQDTELKVQKIKDGTVVDRLTAGTVLLTCQILGIKSGIEGIVLIAVNMPSRKIRTKDILKIEGRELNPSEINTIAVLSPNATINIIRDFKVTEKINVRLPEMIKGIINCPNPYCITNDRREPATTKFKPKNDEGNSSYQCCYCGWIIDQKDVPEAIINKVSEEEAD